MPIGRYCCDHAPRTARSMAQMTTQHFRSLFDIAHHFQALQGPRGAALRRIFKCTGKNAKCLVGEELSAKYNVKQDNEQFLVSVTNRYTLEQTWFNESRTQKPQTFKQEFKDPTEGGKRCDFCCWDTFTAADLGFGRIELPHAVTGSNLFKYAEPSHGIVLFKHHEPLEFSQSALSDVLDASWLWFQANHQIYPHATDPFFLWNCLPKAGASQYHGHAQVMLTEVPVPNIVRLQQASQAYKQQHPSSCYYADLLRAHAAVGLLRQLSIPAKQPAAAATAARGNTGMAAAAAAVSGTGESAASGNSRQRQQQQQHDQHTAWILASLVPYKDMEINIYGRHLCCPAFQKALHAALRAMIDKSGCQTFNVGILNIDLSAAAPAGAGQDRQHYSSAADGPSSSGSSSSNDQNSHCGNGSSSRHTSATSSSNSSGSGSNVNAGADTYIYRSDSGAVWAPDSMLCEGRPPVIARLVSRGKLGNAASDFGCLEVFGGASIGHTDPFAVIRGVDSILEHASN